MKRLLTAVFLLCWAISSLAGEHRHVQGDELWAGECFILKEPIQIHPGKPPLPERLRRNYPEVTVSGVICVDEIDSNGERVVYRVEWIKPDTLEKRFNIKGWVDSADLMVHGVVLSY